ncbi:cytidylyltransferase domain-containing protein [Colwellia sp. BRX9-1]|uniref:acylneuraminate cytidylyltransferase family protein n=1 Tax=Colwellia sp. BRX9-1 TaxID=2759830 RepID=UPI0015F61A6B|nr:acylneuraminate cytidylyltransferase family protein [Colwellia sp. BRX9-1]MBA6353600.1 acylneuraminate cytidylyltransferase family protein [Colwellia sp. BRX9-1]
MTLNKNKILAIIPARAGSKRLPKKNSRILIDKPLIQWTIEAALSCNLIDNVMVSTDDPIIAALSKKLGVNIPFLRPDELSQDNSTTFDVIKHTIEHYKKIGEVYDYILLLQPTSPLRNLNHILESIKLLGQKNADAIVSVCKTEHSPLWANTLNDDGNMDFFINEEIRNKRSQELPDYYRLNGAIYLVRVKCLIEENSMFLSKNIYAYRMSSIDSVDIDTEIDFKFAELIIKEKNNVSNC